MGTINKLSAIDTLSPSDQFPVYSGANGDARRASGTALLNFIKRYFASPEFQTQYATPAATAFTIQVNDTSDNTWLIINPVAGYADGAITLPAVANCVDGQTIMVNCSRQVTTFVVNGNGAIDLQGMPSALSAQANFALRFNASNKIWYRVA